MIGKYKSILSISNTIDKLFLLIFFCFICLLNRTDIQNMKNYLSIIVLAIALISSSAVQAQSSLVKMLSDVPNKTSDQRQADTLANAATKSQSAQIAGYFDNVSIQVELNKISGTAAGKVYLRGSLNGTSYEKYDSLTVANVAQQTKVFSLAPSKYVYYQIQFIGTGTQSTAFKSVGVARKK